MLDSNVRTRNVKKDFGIRLLIKLTMIPMKLDNI